ncbi:MAG: transcriptional regulator [Nocardioides sp.]|nr:transcriptional regulator [Nocardioides sp.]
MKPVQRWSLVAAGVAALLAAPWVVRALPVDDPGLDAADLLSRVQAARDHPYSGYVESRGTLRLPVADRFTDVGSLFGEETRMRVWWRGADRWRVNKLLPSGESDLVHDARGTTQWRYQQNDVKRSADPDIRLPRTADLVPPAVARLLLDDVDPGDVERLPARRVAGVDAAGLRLAPAAKQSSIDHVDLWADPTSGVPLRVEVVAKGDDTAAFTSEFREFSATTPSEESVSFRAPPGSDVSFDDVLDIADAANQYAPFLPPQTVAGLPKAPEADRAVGIYGAGITRLITIPLREREAGPLRKQLELTPGVRVLAEGTVVALGPLGVMLTGAEGDGGWLVAGTVTANTLVRAARDLATRTVVNGR